MIVNSLCWNKNNKIKHKYKHLCMTKTVHLISVRATERDGAWDEVAVDAAWAGMCVRI